MRGFFLGLCTCLVGQVALGETSDEALRRYLAGSDLVVPGHFAKCPIEATSDGSVVQYRTHFSVEKILKADPANETSPDSTLSVIITRFEQGPDDRLPELQEGGRCVLFLCRSSRSESPTYVSADPWFAVQRPLPTLTSELWRLGHDTNVPYEEPTQLTES
ncbi:MAG TPA: hypothetical protein VFT74_06415, partial [Isosphaeraceae bacterium]|nr:hypothetical protein [Isosphaeraceae bacterium]